MVWAGMLCVFAVITQFPIGYLVKMYVLGGSTYNAPAVLITLITVDSIQ